MPQGEAQQPVAPAIPRRLPASAGDQAMVLGGRLSDLQIRCVLTFSARVDAARLARAVRLTLDAEPVLGCRFVGDPWLPYWERLDGLDAQPLCPTVQPHDAERALHGFLAEPLDPWAGLPLRVRLFRAEHDTLCVKVHHAVADGRGVLEYLTLLASTYRELALDPTYQPQPNLHGSRQPSQVWRQAGAREMLHAVRHFSGQGPLAWSRPDAGHAAGPAFAVRRLGPEASRGIRAYSQEMGVTVTAVLLTATYRALFELLDPPQGVPLPMVVAMDLRRHIPSGRAGAICNLSGGLYPAITRRPSAPFSATLQQVHAALEAAKATHVEMAQMLFLHLAFVRGFGVAHRLAGHFVAVRPTGAGGSRFSPGLSNLGVVDPWLAAFGEGALSDLVVFGPANYPPDLGLTVSTFGGRMAVTMGYSDTPGEALLVRRFLELLMGELGAL
ncbi:MAG TPA: hypothetical protein PLJ35_21020 [Anaerolineae bacterium]|nr:hypothetical protein [Anaerolineae bacterium]HOR01305.1 hypothetical protein [Anaerolineae bacterium]